MRKCKVCSAPVAGHHLKITCSDECKLARIKLSKDTFYKNNRELTIQRAKESKQRDPFQLEKSRRYRNKNRERINKLNKNWKLQNKERVVISEKKYRDNNHEDIKKRRRSFMENNPHKEKEYSKKYRDTEKGKVSGRYRAAKRRAAKLNATPEWANKEAIKKIYQDCNDIQWLSEEFLEVDHIVPLQGKDVCGLHIATNLQILTRTENREKSNKLTITNARSMK